MIAAPEQPGATMVHRARCTAAPPRLPADDPAIFDMDLAGLADRWGAAMERPPMSGEAMTGADRRAQALGVPGAQLMEHAGTAVAAAARALAVRTGRWGSGPILVLSGPGNNGGDGFVAARRLARIGAPVVVGFVATEARPAGETSGRNWDPLREPIRSAVDLIRRAREAGVPVLAVDTPTAVDLTSGEATDPVVRADLTVTFHRPKVGLRTRRGAALAGRVLVAPIGIPAEADRG